MHKRRIAWAAAGALLVLAVVLCRVRGHLTPGEAFLGGAVIATVTLLPFLAPYAETALAGFTKKPLRKIEALGMLIFVIMAVIMLAGGAALFVDWLSEPGQPSSGTTVEFRPVLPGGLTAAGTVLVMDLVVGAEVIGGLSLIALYMLSGIRDGV